MIEYVVALSATLGAGVFYLRLLRRERARRLEEARLAAFRAWVAANPKFVGRMTVSMKEATRSLARVGDAFAELLPAAQRMNETLARLDPERRRRWNSRSRV